MLLHTAERQKRSFSCFCTLQKGKKEVFHASAHCRKAKKKIFTLGESYFPKGLAFPRLAKVISRVVWHFRGWRKSFPERFGISALGESHFPKGLAFPRSAKVISRMVWHFRAWRKSFPKRFGISAPGESYFRDNLLKIVTINIHKCKRWSS